MAVTALDYTGPDGLFTQLGAVTKEVNTEHARIITTLPENLHETATVFEAGNADDRHLFVGQLSDACRQTQLSSVAAIERLCKVQDARLLDKGTILNRIPLGEPSVEKSLDALIDDMTVNTKSVKGNVFTIGTITAGSGNVGNGGLVIDKTLDGVSAPCQRFRANRRYLNVASELAIPETLTAVIVVDSKGRVLSPYKESEPFNQFLQPNYVEGNEVVCVFGQTPSANRVSSNNNRWGSGYGIDSEGSGKGPFFYVMNSNLIEPNFTWINNRSFEGGATANEPDNWDAGTPAGVAGTNVFLSTGVFYHGLQSLNFLGGLATIRRSTAVSPQYLVRNKRYYLSMWIQGQAGIAAGDLEICFTGTSYTAASSEKISLNAAALAALTTWGHYGFYITMPATIPSDWALKIEITNTLTAAKNVYFDDINLAPVTWHGGLNFAVYNGATPFAIGDYWTCPITQTETGIIQQHNKRWWGVQMPSSTSDTENIQDYLAV